MLTDGSFHSSLPKLLAAVVPLALAIFAPASAVASGTPPSWSAPVDLTESGVDVYSPRVAVDPAGDAAAVWMQALGDGGYSVMAATRSAGGAWSPPVALSAPGLHTAEPTVAIDADGDAIAAWQQTLGTTLVAAKTHAAGAASWGAQQTLSNPMREAGEPRAAIDPQGDAVVLFTGRDSGGNEIVQASAEQGFGGEWGAPISLSAPGADASSASLGIDDAGEAIAVWQRPNAIGVVVQESRRPAGGSWSSPESLSGNGGEVSRPSLAVNADGDAAVIWSHFAGSLRTAVTTRTAGGTWSVPLDLTPADEESLQARVALDGKGDVTVLWPVLRGEYTVQASTEAAGTGIWSGPVDVVPPDQIPPEPSLAIAPGGDAVVTWQAGATDGSTTVEAATRKGAGGGWSSPSVISAAADDVEQPDVAIEPSGAATAVWDSYDGAFIGVQSANFDPGAEAEAEVPAGDGTGVGGPSGGTSPSSGPSVAAGAATPPAVVAAPSRAARCPKGKVPRRAGARKAKGKLKPPLRCVNRNAPHHHKKRAHHRHQKGN